MARKPLIATAGLLLGVLLAYLPACWAGFIWDDDEYVADNATLWERGGLGKIWFEPGASPQYYPLVFTSFWLEYRVWGLPAQGRPATAYHLANVLLHAANAALLGLALRRLGVPGAWFAAAVFALHPVHVESVAWISERKNVLSGLFYGLALLAYLRFEPPQAAESSAGRWRWYFLALFLFLCALLSKSVTCSLPAVLVLLLWWKRGTWREALALAPLFAVGVLMAAMTAWMERTYVGARGPEWVFTWAEHCLIAGRALWFYAGKLVWPHPLICIYPRWQIDAGAWWQYLFPTTAVVVLLGLFLLRRRFGRGPVVAALFFAGTLVPALGFVALHPMLFSFVADHYQYLASIGIIAPAAALAATTHRLLPTVGRNTVFAAAVLLLGVFGVLSARQCRVYRDLETLWSHTVRKNPQAWIAHYNLGNVRLNQGRPDRAIANFAGALRARPQMALAQHNWGVALLRLGKWAEAREHFLTGVALDPKQPYSHVCLGLDCGHDHLLAGLALVQPQAPLNLASLCLLQSAEEEARRHFADALAVAPDYPETHHELARFLAVLGEWQQAAVYLEQAVTLRPDIPSYRRTMAAVLQQLGHSDKAQTVLDEGLRYRARPTFTNRPRQAPAPDADR